MNITTYIQIPELPQKNLIQIIEKVYNRIHRFLNSTKTCNCS